MPTGWSAVGGLTQSPYVIGGKRWDDGFGGHSVRNDHLHTHPCRHVLTNTYRQRVAHRPAPVLE